MIPIISYHFYSYARFNIILFCISAWFFVNGVCWRMADPKGAVSQSYSPLVLSTYFFLSRFECREMGSGHIYITGIADSR